MMVPYTNFLYFGILLYVAVPTLVVRGISRRALTQVWIVLVTAIMLVLEYDPATLGLVIGYVLIQWATAAGFLYIRRQGKNPSAFYAALTVALVPLVFVKVTPLFPTLRPESLIGFLGISYISFRVIDVLINIHDGLIKTLSPSAYVIYLLFFPTISSGPVDRYRRFLQDWQRPRTRAEFMTDLDGAVDRIFRGLLYKFVLAVLIKRFWLDPAAHLNSLTGIVSYMYAYSFYLFFDFAGYSAFAIGVSYLLGIHSPENFRRPFFARSIRDFWDRWHISLSAWFRDHVYSRFVYAAVKGKRLKSKTTISYLAYFISMGLMGLWHGLTWYYILYGLYHGSLLVGYDLFERKIGSRWQDRQRWMKLRTVVSVFVTFNLVCLGLLLFSGRLDRHFIP